MAYQKPLHHPRYWPLAFSFFIGKFIAKLPMPLLLILGSAIGRAAFYLAKRRRHIIERNIALCFPKLTTQQQKSLVKENFKSLGMAIFEVMVAWWKPEHQVKQLFIYEGIEHLKALQASKQGALLMTAHFCSLELGARALTLITPFAGMYREHKNAYFERAQYEMRQRQSQRPPLNRHQVRQTIRILRNGELFWYAPDQNYGGSNHLFVPFFGVDALTITATSNLCTAGKAKVLPYYCIRKGHHYHITILPPLDNFPSGDEYADCLRLNQLFESWIMQAPEQYLWAHRRFKSRPEGETSLY